MVAVPDSPGSIEEATWGVTCAVSTWACQVTTFVHIPTALGLSTGPIRVSSITAGIILSLPLDLFHVTHKAWMDRSTPRFWKNGDVPFRWKES